MSKTMPRAVNPAKSTANVAALPGRGRAKAAAPPARIFPIAERVQEPEEKEVCPLCVEDLDATDLSFQPCPCGYRICLFCFEKLKLHCNSQCPNCRRVYGSEDARQAAAAAAEAKQAAAAQAAEHNKTALKAPAPTLPYQHTYQNGNAAAAATAAQAAVGTPRQPPGQAPKHPPAAPRRVEGTPVKRPAEEPLQGLPSAATWAAPVASPMASRHQSGEFERPPPPAPMDETAWPSLGEATVAPVKQKPQELNGGINGGQPIPESHVQRANSTTSAQSLDRAASVEPMTQDPPLTSEQLLRFHQHHQQQQQLQNHVQPSAQATALTSHHPIIPTSAQVSTLAYGIRRAVNVPLSVGNNPPVEPYPEASTLLSSMQSAVTTGALSAADAASQLFSLIRQKEIEPTSRPSTHLASYKAPPPGFSVPQPPPAVPAPAPAAAPANIRPPPGFSPLAKEDSVILPGPPVNRCRPISPPPGNGQVYNPLTQHKTVHTNASGAPGTYSLWSGLSGIDLTAANIWASNTAQPTYQPSIQQSQQSSMTLDPPIQYQPIKPPPGFAPPGFAASSDNKNGTYRPNYQPVAPRYNPLEFALGMQAYRPPLGTGL